MDIHRAKARAQKVEDFVHAATMMAGQGLELVDVANFLEAADDEEWAIMTTTANHVAMSQGRRGNHEMPSETAREMVVGRLWVMINRHRALAKGLVLSPEDDAAGRALLSSM